MLDKNDSFNITIGKQYYEDKKDRYSTTVPWESLPNDIKEVYMLIGLRKHKQTSVEAFNASRTRRRDDHQE